MSKPANPTPLPVASIAELEQFVRSSVGHVVEMMRESPDDNMLPMLMVYYYEYPDLTTEKLAIYALAVDWNDAREKYATLRGIGRKTYLARAVPRAAVLTSEAWASPPATPHVRPRDHPDRREVMIVSGAVMDGTCRMARIPVTRNAANHMVPGAMPDPIEVDEAQSNLLEEFYAGFAEMVLRRGR